MFLIYVLHSALKITARCWKTIIKALWQMHANTEFLQISKEIYEYVNFNPLLMFLNR
jgi:5-bromo-4-chloroindolyl phosphate hydrolysis protein